MYKLNNRIENSTLMKLCGKFLSYKDKESKRLVFDDIIIDINPLDWYYNISYNYLIIQDYDWNSIIYDIKNSDIIKKEYNLAIPTHSDKYIVATVDSAFVILNSENFEIISELNTNETSFKFSYFENDVIFFSKETILYSYYIKDGNLLWQYDLSQLKNNPYDDNYERNAGWKIKKIIGVLENKLWIALNHHTIIALDIETGDLVYQIHDIPDFKCEWLPSAIPLSEATVVNEKIGKLIGFMWEFYWEIDPSNGVVQFWDLTDKLLPQEIRNDLSQYVLTDKYIYFASHFASKVGALNRKTKEIDWSYTFDKNENGLEPRIMNIQGNDNTLGALSSKGELYIFEKE